LGPKWCPSPGEDDQTVYVEPPLGADGSGSNCVAVADGGATDGGAAGAGASVDAGGAASGAARKSTPGSGSLRGASGGGLTAIGWVSVGR
jgi:hypothetical protein